MGGVAGRRRIAVGLAVVVGAGWVHVLGLDEAAAFTRLLADLVG